MTSFHVSLIFDGLILAREAEYVNIAYYPNRKTGKSGRFYDIDKIYSPEGKFFPLHAVLPCGERGKEIGEMPKSGDYSTLALAMREC
jgi:hypothetical protein